MVQANSSGVVYQYTFEGAATINRLEQKISPNAPPLVTNKTTGWGSVEYSNNPNNASSSSFDSSSFAVFTKHGSSTKSGIAVKADAAVSLSMTGTIEFMVRANTINDDAFGIAGSATTGSNSRWYFLRNGGAGTDTAYTILGANSQKELIGGSTEVEYTAGDWYYVAQTWSIADGNITIDAYVANLTLGSTSLTQTIDGVTNAHDGGLADLLRIGSTTDTTGYFNGGFDAVAIYNTALDASTLQDHLDTLLVPEPSTTALAAVAFGMLGLVARRKRKD